MARSPYSRVSYQFGPGPLTPAVKALLIANGVLFLAQVAAPSLTTLGGLTPAAVLESFWIWQPFTYMFLHAGLTHLVFNMLALWMFGVELERILARAAVSWRSGATPWCGHRVSTKLSGERIRGARSSGSSSSQPKSWRCVRWHSIAERLAAAQALTSTSVVISASGTPNASSSA